MKIVNQAVFKALSNLGYSDEEVKEIVDFIIQHNTVEGAPHIKEEHIPIFDTAVKPKEGSRSINWQGHVKMVAAVQPFISGAISKTFNMPYETTKEQIEEAYIMAWKLGIKAFAVYRDGSKASQPLQTSAEKKTSVKKLQEVERRYLPPVRKSETHKFVVAGHEGYLTYSVFDDGQLAEIFIRIAKQGSTLAGLLDAFAIAVSMALQYGVPLKALAKKFIHSRFEPAGYTENPQILIATSIVDYIFRYLSLRFLSKDDLFDLGLVHFDNENEVNLINSGEQVKLLENNLKNESNSVKKFSNGYVYNGTVCRKCGGMMVQSGSCYTCLECGESSGGCS
jgi:ribonucleoside-diphosphate reductase alpha chain